MPIVSKSDYALHRRVSRAAISNYIQRGKIFPPALTPDGRIDVGLADRQLAVTVQPIMSLTARARGGLGLYRR